MGWAIKQSGATTSMRRVQPSWKLWEPLPYMERAVQWLMYRHAAGLPLRPGGRKTSITLEAFRRLREEGRASAMLIIAPLRVCRQTWRQEAAKWEQFKDFKFSLLHGDKKEERLKDDADIWLINPEGVDWLCHRFLGRSLPFDIVAIDELTKFKNSQAKRFKALLPRLKGVQWRWGLTGSLASNGYMDLFGCQLILDDGASLGRYITHYRDQYFQVDFDGFTYNLMPGAAARIIKRLEPYWFKMDDADYAQLPPLVPDPINIELSPAARKTYNTMKKQMIAELPEGIITAANSAACYSKLSQMANGAVYVGDQREVAELHNLKIEALDELVDNLNGEQLIVAYEFNHDLERIKHWHQERFGKPLPYLGKGTTAKQETEHKDAWNKGTLPILAAHPASAGHGLNLQESSACHVCWFSITWDYELWDQFIRRLRRDGTLATQIWNHMLIVKDTIDELKLEALSDKGLTQSGLLQALNKEIQRSAETQGVSASHQHGDSTMKLSRPGSAAAESNANQSATPAAETKAAPKGWGQKGAATPADDGQKDRIRDQIDPEANRTAFSSGVRETARQISTGEERQDPAQAETPAAEPATRTRRRSADKEATPTPAVPEQLLELLGSAGTAYIKMEAVKAATAILAGTGQPLEDTDTVFALADEVVAYVTK